MAGLIVKSPYLKCGEDHSVSGYLHYIGTRERVELLPDDRPPTRKQEQFITKLVKYFPNVKELNEFSGSSLGRWRKTGQHYRKQRAT
mgnify:CR=1 FL=1